MNLFVLDTDILTIFQHGHATVRRNVAAHPITELVVTVISVEEQLSGWYGFIRKAKQIDKVAWGYDRLSENIMHLASLQILSFGVPSIQRFDSLFKLKLNIRNNDLRIAAIVLETGATLVTRNTRDFKQVPGLRFVDWSQ